MIRCLLYSSLISVSLTCFSLISELLNPMLVTGREKFIEKEVKSISQEYTSELANSIDTSNEPRNPGPPLGEKDFFLASQLPIVPTNVTTDQLMQIVADGELAGSVNNPAPSLNDSLNMLKETKNGIAALENHWGNAIIPYTIDAAFSDSERAVIAQGIQHVEENSCLRFVPRNGENDYVQIHPGDGGCYAVIPYRIGSGMREIGLEQNGCVYMKVVVHEILHVVGVKHEQCRPDRDEHITIDWSNIQDGGPSQYYKDNWVGDPEPTNICKETLDYANCRSTFFTTACDLPYDYASIMHYGARSFAIDGSKDVMTAKDTSVTTLGNTELSELDKQKLQCLYQCDATAHSNCGGHFFGESGTLTSDGSTGCEWLLRASTGKGIILNFSGISSVACSDLTIDVWYGRSTEGERYRTWCSGDDVSSLIHTRTNELYIKVTMTAGALPKGADIGSWTTEDLTCCNSVMVENFDGQTSRQGVFTKMTDGTTENEHPVYSNADTNQQLWMGSYGKWYIGDDYTSGSYGIASAATSSYCPEDSPNWSYYSGEMVLDQDANVRCSDCSLYPAETECITCCDTVTLTSPSDLGGYQVFVGEYSLYTSNPKHNGQKVYKLAGQDYCLYYSSCGNWWVTDCSSSFSGCGGYVKSSSGTGCVYGSDYTWIVSGSTVDGMKAECNAQCASDAPAAPDGATAAGSGKDVGTIVTYTCSTGGAEAKAICDAATVAWIPATIPVDLCSGGSPAPAPSPPAPAPSPPTAATPCQKRNKVPVLKGKKKRKSTAEACKALCSSCTRWNFKNASKAKKRKCYVMNVTFKKAKGWVSGQRVEECGDKLTPGDAIVDNMKSALKGVSGFPDITSANDCTAKCSEVADCQYYKFNKKKGCFLLQIQHVEAGGWFTA